MIKRGRITMDEKRQIENVVRSMETVMESDERTLKCPVSETGWIYDHIHEWKKTLIEYIDSLED